MTVNSELYLRRLTVDEALYKLDHYLNTAFLANLHSIRIIHGKGTGLLCQVIRMELKSHPLVESFRPGDYGEGGAGVTIVKLASQQP